MPIQAINPDTLAKPAGYTHVMAATGGTTLYLAGQGAFDRDWKLVGAGDLVAQAEQATKNLLAALEAGGATPANLVKTTIYVVGLTDASMPDVFKGMSAGLAGTTARPPASTMVGVERLAIDGMLIEIEGIAVVDG